MFELLWLVPALPFAGFLVLALFGARLQRAGAAWVGIGSVGLSALVSLLIVLRFLSAPPPGNVYVQHLWTWLSVGGLSPGISFYLDPLSLVMMMVVTFVGFFIHLYSAEFMEGDEGYSRFFAYMNLFVGSMLVLVLGENLLLLYLGWEGVGLCSYLLIGFWYKDPPNGYAAIKAFIVTRVGDTAMAIGLFLLFSQLGSLQIQELMRRAAQQWPVGSGLAVAAALLLLGGAVGKSAQIPLQTWLPDAMAGPTPVSALIHAATMVTAGVYLIARTHVLFELAPAVQHLVAVIGSVTLLVAGFSALTQWDIKRVLAYSTISQIGYMFLALGVGAWSAAIFHFLTHAFFKALLFLGAGVVIEMLHDEHDMFKMGGLRRQLPVTFWCFLIGAASLAALPLVTAGFYSKDLILWHAWASGEGNTGVWLAGLLGTLITALYTFRMVFLTFFGEAKTKVERKPGWRMLVPLVVLAFFSLVAGFVELPHSLGNLPLFTDFIERVLPPVRDIRGNATRELGFLVLTGALVLLGVFLADVLYLLRPELPGKLVGNPLGAALRRFWFAGWGFDWLYHNLLVRPYVTLARLNKGDFIDLIYRAVAWVSEVLYGTLSGMQKGLVRWYAMAIVIGAAILLAIVVFL